MGGWVEVVCVMCVVCCVCRAIYMIICGSVMLDAIDL